MSLLMSCILGGGSVEQKFSPFRSKFVCDCVSWRLHRFTIFSIQNLFCLPGFIGYCLFRFFHTHSPFLFQNRATISNILM